MIPTLAPLHFRFVRPFFHSRVPVNFPRDAPCANKQRDRSASKNKRDRACVARTTLLRLPARRFRSVASQRSGGEGRGGGGRGELLYQFEVIFSLERREQADFVNPARNLAPRFSSTRKSREAASRGECNNKYRRDISFPLLARVA